MALKKFSELTTIDRGAPCQEYPGEWLSYVNGNEEKSFTSFEAAQTDANKRQSEHPSDDAESSVCWKASDNDPRIGEVWFTSFYQEGYFDIFGRWRS